MTSGVITDNSQQSITGQMSTMFWSAFDIFFAFLQLKFMIKSPPNINIKGKTMSSNKIFTIFGKISNFIFLN